MSAGNGEDTSLRLVDEIVQTEFGALCARYPEQREPGGTLLLGKYYAHHPGGILMLGLNPGGTYNAGAVYTKTYPENCLLPGAASTKIAYWRNARTLFGVDGIHQEMELATYSFCCPFRTRNWNGLPASKRSALIEHSAPVMQQMLRDCMPSVIIVAGRASLAVFQAVAGPAIRIDKLISDEGAAAGTYQWRSYRCRLNESPCVLAQIPHLSRASSRERLKNCGRWLGDVLRQAA